jgi:PAS domain S-box-containing protein
MLDFTKQFLSPPIFSDDPNKTAVAKILNDIFLFYLFIILGLIPILTIVSEELTRTLSWTMPLLVILVGVKFLVGKGYVYQASKLLILLIWLIAVVTTFTGGGVNAPGYSAFVVLVLLAGLLLGKRYALGMAILNGCLGFTFLWLDSQGRLPYSAVPNNDFQLWLFHFATAVMVALLVWTGLGSIREALSRIQFELQQRKLSEERFEKIFLVSPNALFISDLNSGEILHVNESLERLSGYSKDDLVGHTVSELSIYDGADFRETWLDILQKQGRVRELEMQLRFADGETHTCSISIETLQLEDRPCVITHVKDITEWNQAMATLSENESRFRSIFEDAGIGMVLVSLSHSIAKTNRAFAQMLGYTEDELIGVHFTDITHPDDINISVDHHQRLIQGEIFGYQFEKRYLHKQGHFVWAMLNVSLVRSADGQPNQAIAQIQNIDDRKHAEADREMLIQELERRNAELERFAYTVSHDLKSPLVTIGGFLGFLKRDAESGDLIQLKTDIDSIRSATEKMRVLLDELLELSRIGRLMNTPEEIPFVEIVGEALSLVRGQLVNCGVEVEIADETVTVLGDRVRLIAVVQNLVDNAAKFSRDQSLPHIKIGVREEDGLRVFFVEDNGIGIPSQYHDKIFDIFNRLNPDVEGTGIGLALVKRIVEVHNGRLWVESDGLGQGSTFCFTLNEAAPSKS